MTWPSFCLIKELKQLSFTTTDSSGEGWKGPGRYRLKGVYIVVIPSKEKLYLCDEDEQARREAVNLFKYCLTKHRITAW